MPSRSPTALALAVLLLGASCGGGGGPPPTEPHAAGAPSAASHGSAGDAKASAGLAEQTKTAPAVVGPEGGAVALADGTGVWIPPGALSAPQTITIAPAPSSAAPAGATRVGASYVFGPEGLKFAVPATVTLAYDPRLLPKGKRSTAVRVYTSPAGGAAAASQLPTARVGATHVEARTTHFSLFSPDVPDPDEPTDGPYYQLDIFASASGAATDRNPVPGVELAHAKQAVGIPKSDWPPPRDTDPNVTWPDAPVTEGWNQEIVGVPFKWANQTQNLLSDENGPSVYDADGQWVSGAKGDSLRYVLKKPRRATHLELLVTSVFGNSVLKGATLGRVEVTYEDGTVDKLDLVLGTNLRNNHFFLPTDPASRLPGAQFSSFVADFTDRKHVHQFQSKMVGPVHYAIDRVSLPLSQAAVHARKRVSKILIRNLPREVRLPDIGNTVAPVVARPQYTGLQIWGVTLGKEYPAIMVPGIMGTTVSAGSATLPDSKWPNALLTGDPDSLANVGFEDSGAPKNPDLKECELMGQGDWQRSALDFYHGLIEFMGVHMGYRLAKSEASPEKAEVCWTFPTAPDPKDNDEREDLYTLPYDWRLDTRLAADKLKQLVQNIKSRTGADKVDIIAHSLGGVVSRIYLAKGGFADVDTFITLGTPFYGAPAVFTLERFGATEAPGHEAAQRVGLKRLARNLWGEYVLQPSNAYFAAAGNYYTYNAGDVRGGTGQVLGGSAPMSPDDMRAWIGAVPCRTDFSYPAWAYFDSSLGASIANLFVNPTPIPPCTDPQAPLYNARLVAWAKGVHDDIDGWDNATDDAPWKYAILGNRFSTLVGAGESLSASGKRTMLPARCESGDGSVAPKSALGFPPSVRKHVFVRVKHADLANDATVQKQIQLYIPGIEEVADGASAMYDAAMDDECKVP